MTGIDTLFGGIGPVVLVWAKYLFYTAFGGMVAYSIYVYFFEYNIIVEYVKVMGNNAFKEQKLRAKRDDKSGVVKYKVWRSNLILKKPDDFSFITVLKGNKEKIRVIAAADKQYYFTRLNIKTMAYDCIPAEIEEYSMLAEEQIRQKYQKTKDFMEKNGPMISMAIAAIVFIVAMWFVVGMMQTNSAAMNGVAANIAEAARQLAQSQTPLPDPMLPN